MYPPDFDYVRATSVRETISLLEENRNAKLLAGGHSLIPLLKLRTASADMLIDIGRIDELKGISRINGTFRIGALSTHSYIAATGGLPSALTDAASHIGDWQVRNRGTIGGNVAHADPASDHPTVLTALGANFHISGAHEERTIPASEFFTDMFTTALRESEVITVIDVPARGKDTGSAYAKMIHAASAYSVLGVAAVLSVIDGRCTAASVAIGGLTPKATKAPSVESALIGKMLDEATLKAASQAILDDLGDDILGDFYASADYRMAMAPEYVHRALKKAAERAGG